MNFIKRQSVGFYLNILTAVVAIIGLAAYIINCKTTYFINFGVDKKMVTMIIAAVVLEILLIVLSQKLGPNRSLDILPVASTVLLVITLVMFISSRTNSIAAITTFDNNAQNMQDLTSAIIGIAACGVAVFLSIIASFFKLVRE